MSAQRPERDIAVLIAKIERHRRLLNEIENEVSEAMAIDIEKLGKSSRAGLLVAGLFENYYTCAETLFLRISQFFENNLSADRWHKDLLEKMTLDIEQVRPVVLSDEVYLDLQEFMRFRHFKRYYFSTAYDWTRLDELLIRFKRVHPLLMRDIGVFSDCIRSLEA